MAISLYDVSVASFKQTLTGVAGYLEKGLAHCKANNIDLLELVDFKLAPDMLPFRFQIIAVAHHSRGALAGVKAGVFRPPTGPMDQDYAGLQKLILLQEAYPQLKADANFRDLSAKLVEVEEQLQFARRFYNGAVKQYVTRLESFPDVLVARFFNFKPMPFFETDDRSAVKVAL